LRAALARSSAGPRHEQLAAQLEASVGPRPYSGAGKQGREVGLITRWAGKLSNSVKGDVAHCNDSYPPRKWGANVTAFLISLFLYLRIARAWNA